MKMSKMKLMGLLVALMMLVLVGCNSNEDTENASSSEAAVEETSEEVAETEEVEVEAQELAYDGSLEILSEDKSFEIAYNDIFTMTAVQADVKHISSSGEESQNSVEGVTIESILATEGLSKANYTGIRFTAGDGYAVTVPADVFLDKDVILAYKFDGEILEAKKMPLRVAINDERSMYYVSNVVTVELMNEEVAEETESVGNSKVVMLETVTATVENEEFMYYDSNDLAVSMTEILGMVPADGSSVAFVATDGYAKEEAMDVVSEGFIKITGEDAPLFTGLDLPIGMNVKYVLTMAIGDTTFVSVNSAAEAGEMLVIDDVEGVKLSSIIDMAGLSGDFYVLAASDGYSVEVTAESTMEALVYLDDDGTARVKYAEGYPKNANLKGFLTITVGDGSKTEMVVTESTDEATEENKDEAVEEESEDLWVITVDGLSDGSFDFNSGRAERKLDLVSLHTSRSKNDVVTEEDWEGYKVNDVLAFLRVEDYKSITVTAMDGYSVELMKEQVDDETILAVTRDGEALSEPDNMVQLVQNTEFATTWIKGVATITVNN